MVSYLTKLAFIDLDKVITCDQLEMLHIVSLRNSWKLKRRATVKYAKLKIHGTHCRYTSPGRKKKEN